MSVRASRWPSAVAALVRHVRTDHEAMRATNSKYASPHRSVSSLSLGRDAVEKVGFQLMAAYRLMRFFVDVDARLASRVTSRAIRHLYGSDIHWDADLAPGVMVVHGMGMAISNSARIEAGVLIFQHVTVGEGRHPDTHEVGAPTIERDVVLGAGATVLGPITIGARSKIMPGCVIVRSVPPDSIVESPAPTVRSRRRGASREAGE